MLIYEEKRDISFEELEQRCKDLEQNFPELDWPQWHNFIGAGVIRSYKGSFSFGPQVMAIYYNHNIAVIGERLENPDTAVEKLQKLGYHVPLRKMLRHNLSGRDIISPESILWNELRFGKGWSRIKQHLETLLTPVLTSVKNAEKIEFAVYNPFIVTSTDDVLPPYIEYKEIFQLPTHKNGMVDLGILLKKIRTMPVEQALAISSKVQTKKGEKHIPMVDFRSEDEIYYKDVISVLSRLNLPNPFVIDSGNSFHHHNTHRLLSEEHFYNYLEDIAKQPEIGRNWPWFSAHQGFSLLRIAPCAAKPSYPIITKGD